MSTKQNKMKTVKLTFGRNLLNVTNVYRSNDGLTIAFNTLSGLFIFKTKDVLAIY